MRHVVLGWSLVLCLCSAARGADVPADRATLVRGNTRFALELYHQLRTQDGNLFLSPYSISSALAMPGAGARGRTADEMARTLRLDLPPQQRAAAFRSLMKEINGEADKKRGYQ